MNVANTFACGLAAFVVACAGTARADAPPAPTPAPTPVVVGEAPPPLMVGDVVTGDASAEDLTWENLMGKVVVLEFWATWCGPCVSAIPHLNELAEEHPDVVFIAITGEDRAVVEPFLERRPIKAQVVLDDARQTSRAFQTRGIPRTIIVGKDGKLAADTHPTVVKGEHLAALLAGNDPEFPQVIEQAEAPAGAGGFSAWSAGRLLEETMDEDFVAPLSRVVLRESKTQGSAASYGGGALTLIGYSPDYIVTELYGTRVDLQADLPEGRFDLTTNARDDQGSRRLGRAAVEAAWDMESALERRDTPVLVVRRIEGSDGLVERDQEDVIEMGISMRSSDDFEFDARVLGLTYGFQMLERWLNMPVLDETELVGLYDYKIIVDEKTPEAVRDALLPLGFEVVEEERPVEITVIRKAE